MERTACHRARLFKCACSLTYAYGSLLLPPPEREEGKSHV